MRNWNLGDPYLLGYSHQQSVEAGNTIDVRVSTPLPSYRADLVRLRHGDENPAGPGFCQREVTGVATQQSAGRIHATPLGSAIHIPSAPCLDIDSLVATIWFKPTLFSGEQHLLSWLDEAGVGAELVLDDAGRLVAKFPGRDYRFSVGPLHIDTWHLVGFGLNRSSATAQLVIRTHPRSPVAPATFDASAGVNLGSWKSGEAPLVIGGPSIRRLATRAEIHRIGTLYGRIADPAIWRGPLDQILEQTDDRPDPGHHHLLAYWDLGRDPQSDLCRDVGPHGHHGRLINGGTRLVTGPLFSDSGEPPQAHTHNALHLHGDDVLDAGWDPDLEIELPRSLPPGVYAIRLSAGDLEEHVPLFVRSQTRKHHLAILFPTFTYLAYGNERMNFGTIQLPDAQRADRLQGIDHFIDGNPWLGASLYDQHADRSGVTQVSRHRPLVTMRPEHRSWLSGDPRHFSADLYLVDWLEHHGYDYDVLTDDDLHREGEKALAGYRVVLTGSHPEYVTGPMLDTLHGYLGDGGRLMYLGGNGFYWVTSSSPQRPEVIEVRRGHAGSRTWESWPGDEFHSTTMEVGGLWRHRGRPPNQLVGVGFAASGWGGAAGAFRVIQPVPDRAAFVFDGIDHDEPIGNFGLIMNGCVGEEVDRWDPRQGSARDAIRLATCADLDESYVIVVEDTIGTGVDITSSTHPGVRADMVLLPTRNGGAVFSVGTMAWIGSLSHRDYDNTVSRITRNVLERFLSEEPI